MNRAAMILSTLVIVTSNIAYAAASPGPHPVIELRQYKIVAGERDTMIDLFERKFIESQETLGMRLIGQFRDLDDPNRFTWIRGFPDMPARGTALNQFYFGPVWQANRATANPLLADNDNVLLLRPAAEASGFGPAGEARAATGATPKSAHMIVATIYYLWKDPNDGFSEFFREQLAPAYTAVGLAPLGEYVPEAEPNNFPQLPVRQNEKVFVWFTRIADPAAYDAAMDKLTANEAWRTTLAPKLSDYEERAPQILRLAPTARSQLR